MSNSKQQIAVSVIIPIHNTPVSLFDDCIESLIRQTLEDFEIIIIDNASNRKFSDRYRGIASKTNKATIIRTEERGVSNARNIGIKNARGCYLCFIDSDDKVSKSFLEELYKKAKDCEVVIPCRIFKTTSSETYWKFDKSNMVFPRDIIELTEHSEYFTCAGVMLANKKYSAMFDLEMRFGEDINYVISRIGKEPFCFCKNAKYFYIDNSESTTNDMSESDFEKYIKDTKKLLDNISAQYKNKKEMISYMAYKKIVRLVRNMKKNNIPKKRRIQILKFAVAVFQENLRESKRHNLFSRAINLLLSFRAYTIMDMMIVAGGRDEN